MLICPCDSLSVAAVASRGSRPRVEAALLTVDQVLQVKGGLPWSAQTAAALYGRLQGCSERAMLADGALHTAKNIPKELIDSEYLCV